MQMSQIKMQVQQDSWIENTISPRESFVPMNREINILELCLHSEESPNHISVLETDCLWASNLGQ